MSIADFLETLRDQEIALWTEGDQLRCKAPVGAVSQELRRELTHRRADIVKFLHAAQTLDSQPAAIVPIQPGGLQTPIFAVPGHSGDVFCFRALAKHLGSDQPFFGLEPPGLDGRRPAIDSVEALAADFARQILAYRPGGPYVIAGYCAGGAIAFEVAQQLSKQGASIAVVALFGSPFPSWYRFFPQLRVHMAEQAMRVAKHLRAITSLSPSELADYIAEKRQQRQLRSETSLRAATDPVLIRRAVVEKQTLAAVRRYVPEYFAGRVVTFLPSNAWMPPASRLLRWPASIAQQVEEYCGPASCEGYSMLLEPHVEVFADSFRRVSLDSPERAKVTS